MKNWIERLSITCMFILMLVWIHSLRRQTDENFNLIEKSIDVMKKLSKENAAQWKRISELEIMLCHPELIDCEK